MEKELEIALTSPALKGRSKLGGTFSYPKKWKDKVPLRVKILKTACTDLPYPGDTKIYVYKDQLYYVWVNSFGAVAAIFPNSDKLGLRQDEFEVIEFHK